MKKLTFKVSLPKDCSVVSLLKEVNKIHCRMCHDFENDIVVVEDVNDRMIDNVIELINNYYTIKRIDIDNTFEETIEQQDIFGAEKATVETADQIIDAVAEKQPTVLEPQSEDDLIIKKVEFENELVEKRINDFLKTAYWALYKKRATEKDISEYILTCMSEISMRYSTKPIIEFCIGDIVDVNYGSHLLGETIGGHVHAIVCDILNNDMAYVVPITKERTEIISQSYLFMNTPQDAIYGNEFYKGGTVLVNKGKYVRAERFNSVVGKTKQEFFAKLLYHLAYAFDFTACLGEIGNEDEELLFTTEEITDEVVANTTEYDTDKVNTVDKVVKSEATAKKVGVEEEALLKVIGFAIDKLDASKEVENQLVAFLTDIGMPTTEKILTQSFIIACGIRKINYENVIEKLHALNPKINKSNIKAKLKENFKSWLEQYPTLAEKCPKISLMSVIKIFAKKFDEE